MKPNQTKPKKATTTEKPYENMTLSVLYAYIFSSKQRKNEFIRGSPPFEIGGAIEFLFSFVHMFSTT